MSKQPGKAAGRRDPVATGIAGKVLMAAGFVVVVVLLMAWLAGSFHRKIDSTHATPVAQRPVGDARTSPVRVLRVPATESAVGTIRAVHETAVASKLLAKVSEVNVIAGQMVSAGEVLVRLDDGDLRARLQQLEAAVESARAARDQAGIEFRRVQALHDQGQAAQIEFDRAQTALKTAESELVRAQQASEEAATILDYATIRSPIDGKVVDKRIEVGDTAQPGQVLVTLFDPTRMQLVARVRESLAHRLSVGQTLQVGIDALKQTCAGRISEIVPEAESASRSFSVKVTGPCPDGVYSGMFGRLYVPLDEEEVLVVPQAAVRRVGQLDLVDVVESEAGGRVLRRRTVRLGKEFGDDVQILSGLKIGEEVAIPGGRA